jgi:pilus assembly protein Flp/PilA
MKELLLKLCRDEEGQDLAEYGLLVALIAVGVIIGVGAFGTQMNTFFTNLGATLGLPGI